MKKHFPYIKINRFPLRCLTMDFEKDILGAEQSLISKYGFVKEEINFIMKSKPTFIIIDERSNEGIHVVHKLLVEDKGFDKDVVRTLVVKYPYILGKTREQLEAFFDLLKYQGFSEDECMRSLLECPKLISMELDH